MTKTSRLRVAALIDLPRTPHAGGHVKGWERLAHVACRASLPLDLTLFFSGSPHAEDWGPHVHIRHLPPVFSTARLKFMPYVPDHTDLAPYHPALARELVNFDLIHTTDGYFAFTRTAERVCRSEGIPLVTSFHTDTPGYARIFTRKTIHGIFGDGKVTDFLCDTLRLPERQEARMIARMHKHLRHCDAALVSRIEDRRLAEGAIAPNKIVTMRLGVDRAAFGPHRRDREGVERDYKIPAFKIALLFVGRLDEGKNIYTLIEAMERLLADGYPLHLVTAGLGPAETALRKRLGEHVTVAGFVQPPELARLYASVDALALTSEVETRSQAAIEATTSGCPVLIAEKSGVARLFGGLESMEVIEGGADAWARAIAAFSTSKAKREAMRAAALAHGKDVIADWDEVFAQDIFGTWEKVANQKNAFEP